MSPASRLLPSTLTLVALAIPAVAQEALQPVIARMEMRFSVISHRFHQTDKVSFYNANGGTGGAQNYAVPHLVYEPLVTLYNPYNTRIELPSVQLAFANPPVLFKFTKVTTSQLLPYRPSNPTPFDAVAQGFYGISRFTATTENNPATQKTFTMTLGGGTPDDYDAVPLVLEPGESRLFATRIEQQWNWEFETAGGYEARSFLDWHVSDNFTNRDGRTGNPLGIEMIGSGFNPYTYNNRAGFQTDSLSFTPRPDATRYTFEKSSLIPKGEVATTMLTDSVKIEAKGGLSHSSLQPDFELTDPLGRKLAFLAGDVLRAAGTPSIITRTYAVSDLLQLPGDKSPAGKKTVANFAITVRNSALKHRLFHQSELPPPNALYLTKFEQLSGTVPEIGSVGTATDAPGTLKAEVFGIERVADKLMIDFSAAPGNPYGWKIQGTSDPEQGFTETLSSVFDFSIVEGPPGTGIYKAIIDVSGKGPGYFVRIGR